LAASVFRFAIGSCGERFPRRAARGIGWRVASSCTILNWLAPIWCKLWCKPTIRRRLPIGPRGQLGTPRIGIQGQGGQRVEGAGHVQQPRVGIDIHRQVDGRMPHGGLRRPRSNAPFAQERTEAMPQRVYVDGPPAVIALGDTGCGQVAV
jgi:hypothetical protein